MENKFCLKSRQELDEIRKAKASKKSEVNEISAKTFNNAMRKRIDQKFAAKQDVIDRPYSLNAKIDHKIASDKLDKFFDAADKRQTRHKKAGWSDGNSTYSKELPKEFTKIPESKIDEDWKEHDYQYLSIRQALEDIEDEYTREKYLKDFEGLIKRLEYSSNSTDESLEVSEISDELAKKVNNKRFAQLDKAREIEKETSREDSIATANYLDDSSDDNYTTMKKTNKAYGDAFRDRVSKYDKAIKNSEMNLRRIARKKHAQSESLTASSALEQSKTILEGLMPNKYGEMIDSKEWEEKEAKGLNEAYEDNILNRFEDSLISKVNELASEGMDEEQVREALTNYAKELLGDISDSDILKIYSWIDLYEPSLVEPIRNLVSDTLIGDFMASKFESSFENANEETYEESLDASKALEQYKEILETESEIDENSLPYVEGTTPNDLDNIWVVRAWVDNMDSEDGYDNLEFTKVGLIDYINDISSSEISKETSDEELKNISELEFEAKVIEIRPYSTGFRESVEIEEAETLVPPIEKSYKLDNEKRQQFLARMKAKRTDSNDFDKVLDDVIQRNVDLEKKDVQ